MTAEVGFGIGQILPTPATPADQLRRDSFNCLTWLASFDIGLVESVSVASVANLLLLYRHMRNALKHFATDSEIHCARRERNVLSLRPVNRSAVSLRAFQALVDLARLHDGTGYRIFKEYMTTRAGIDLIDLVLIEIQADD